MTKFRHIVVALVASILIPLVSASLAQAACSTTNPMMNFAGETKFASDAEIQSTFTASRAAEGCATPLVLPAGYDSMTPQQQMLTLFNLEREARGETALKLDPTIMSQVAQSHSQEMATYNYFSHASPINQKGLQTFTSGVIREMVNPVFSKYFFGENLAAGYSTAAQAVWGYMYDDAESNWGHRGAILQGEFNWVGIGIVLGGGGEYNNYWTDDFAHITGAYTPPAKADTKGPVLGPVTYANGEAKVTGVADSPENVNDKGATPLTAGVTDVVFYTNKIAKSGAEFEPNEFNTVSATETPAGSGTWTAKITVNTGEVLHAVAVDGSGNFTDSSPPPPPVPLTGGENTVALPAAEAAEEPAGEGAAPAVAAAASTGDPYATAADYRQPRHQGELAITPNARALVDSIDSQLGRNAVKDIKVYVNDEWQTYYPCGSAGFPLYAGEGVVVDLKPHVTGVWQLSKKDMRFSKPPTLQLQAGWNFVSVPYPANGLTIEQIGDEIASGGDRVKELTIGPAPEEGVTYRPTRKGRWDHGTGDVPDEQGLWVKVDSASTWTPSEETEEESGKSGEFEELVRVK
ncbi:MAG TPA: CAP domain-containing protein [Solirubrobacteraceae bacterium]|nr:CAP domain-containing protein [Solirubrobacteraceae bacterium]